MKQCMMLGRLYVPELLTFLSGEDRVARMLLPNESWILIEPLMPTRPPRPEGGRPPIGDGEALTGILFVLKNGEFSWAPSGTWRPALKASG